MRRSINGTEHTEHYDTLIMINVVEHVMDAVTLMRNIYHALKPGGLLIFHEKHMDHEHGSQAPCIRGEIPTLQCAATEYAHPQTPSTPSGPSRGIATTCCRVRSPIRIHSRFLAAFSSMFEPLLLNQEPTAEMAKAHFNCVYLIGRKLAAPRCETS